MKSTVRSFVILLLLALICLVVGLAANTLREKPLPLVHKDKAERIADASERLQSGTPELGRVREVELEEFQGLLEKGSVVLDARPEVFHRMGHIPGALSLPREEFEEAYSRLRERLESHRGEAVLIYCSRDDCEDSHLVAKGLAKLGFRDIAVLRGGWNEWQRNGLPVEKTP